MVAPNLSVTVVRIFPLPSFHSMPLEKQGHTPFPPPYGAEW